MDKNNHPAEMLRVGMKVRYRPDFGYAHDPSVAEVVAIELCDEPDEKYGDRVTEVEARNVKRCVLDLDNGFWCYGTQVDEILG